MESASESGTATNSRNMFVSVSSVFMFIVCNSTVWWKITAIILAYKHGSNENENEIVMNEWMNTVCSRTCFPYRPGIIAIFWSDCYCFVNHHFFDGSCQHIDAVLFAAFRCLLMRIFFQFDVCVHVHGREREWERKVWIAFKGFLMDSIYLELQSSTL